MENSSNRQQSEFNMAVSYLNRLNLLFYLADEAAMELDVNKWMHSLMTIQRELSTEMDQKELDDMKAQFKKINSLIHGYNDEIKRRGMGTVNPDLYDLLHDAELKIRRVLKDSGLQMKMKQDAANALMDV